MFPPIPDPPDVSSDLETGFSKKPAHFKAIMGCGHWRQANAALQYIEYFEGPVLRRLTKTGKKRTFGTCLSQHRHTLAILPKKQAELPAPSDNVNKLPNVAAMPHVSLGNMHGLRDGFAAPGCWPGTLRRSSMSSNRPAAARLQPMCGSREECRLHGMGCRDQRLPSRASMKRRMAISLQGASRSCAAVLLS